MENQNSNPSQAPAACQNPVPSQVEASNVPEKFDVTRNGVTLSFVKQAPRRKGKGGKELFPTFAPVITIKNLGSYIRFAGKEEFLADLNGSIFTSYYKQQQDPEDSLWSPNGLKFDMETAIVKAIGEKQAKIDLQAESEKLAQEFAAAQNSGNIAEITAVALKFQALLAKQAEQKHKGKK